jgi:hypothetical protein
MSLISTCIAIQFKEPKNEEINTIKYITLKEHINILKQG